MSSQKFTIGFNQAGALILADLREALGDASIAAAVREALALAGWALAQHKAGYQVAAIAKDGTVQKVLALHRFKEVEHGDKRAGN